MPEALGLSIGMTNSVAASLGRAPVTRRAVLTPFTSRSPAAGRPSGPSASPTERMAISEFVQRMGDPTQRVPAGETQRFGEHMLVGALDAMADNIGDRRAVAVAVPAHWGPGAIGALQRVVRERPDLAPPGVRVAVVSDAAAALAALQSGPGLPDHGVVALCDFGSSGTSITLANAASNYRTIGETVRYTGFSGDQIDQAVLAHVVGRVSGASSGPSLTASIGSFNRLLDECRQAKERLSTETVTTVPVVLPGLQTNVSLTRNELEGLIARPLDGFLTALAETLERNRIGLTSLSAAATVGGGAQIPLITRRLSEQLRVPVVTTSQPQLDAAAGAALLADRADSGAFAAADTPQAWSEDAPSGLVALPTEDMTYDPDTGSPVMAFTGGADDDGAEPEPLKWYLRPAVIFAAALTLVVFAGGGLAYTLAVGTGTEPPPTTTTTTTSTSVLPPPPTTAPPVPPPPPPPTVDNQPRHTSVPPRATHTTDPPITCPNGSVVPAGQHCVTTDPPITCPDGSTVPAGHACVTTDPPITCPDGSTVPAGTPCPTPDTKTCPDGSTVPAGTPCPTGRPPTQCPDGSTVPAGQPCPTLVRRRPAARRPRPISRDAVSTGRRRRS